ncbi:MAG TPA: asparaginase domain-containing protein [Stellaceae bacterium]|nr:asparaginase domain-containing protein [Stellaceae bacterium]
MDATQRESFKIAVIMTGGTIAKTYDPRKAVLRNVDPVIKRLIRGLRLVDAKVSFKELMRKDSLDLDRDDRTRIIETARSAMRRNHAVVIIHGTDTLSVTGEALLAAMPTPRVPIVLTGAMVPFVVEGSDGLQNVTEALFACRLLAPGIYAVFHGRALAFPSVVKDRETLTFVRTSGSISESAL